MSLKTRRNADKGVGGSQTNQENLRFEEVEPKNLCSNMIENIKNVMAMVHSWERKGLK